MFKKYLKTSQLLKGDCMMTTKSPLASRSATATPLTVMNFDNNVIPKMLTINETAKQTGLPAYFIRQCVLQGKIKYIKAGKKYLINLDKLVEFLNDGEEPTMGKEYN